MVVETGALSETGPPTTTTTPHHMPFSIFHGISNPTTFISQEVPTFGFGELAEAIVLQGVRIGSDESKAAATLFNKAPPPAATVDMFPSWPIRFHQTPRGSSKSKYTNTDSSHPEKTQKELAEESESPVSNKAPLNHHHHPHHHLRQHFDQKQSLEEMAGGETSSLPSPPNQQPQPVKPLPEKRKGGGSSSSDKPLDAKTLRRLAQNREAARKSRLRKKAYVQQLESSRMKLTQLEQDLHRARSQGLFLGGCSDAGANLSSGAAIFNMEYARWLEDDRQHMSELRTSLQAHLSDSDLKVIVDGYISHYDKVFRLRCTAAKCNIFHLITGTWMTPVERCFLWMAGFRPSEIIKILIPQLDPLTEQQLMGIYSLQQSSQQAEEALSQGFDQLQQSLVDSIAGGSVIDGMHQMGIALGKLANLEGFVRQADNLRQQTLHQLRRILTVRQAARCFLVIGEYYGRLRALSSLWQSRPQDRQNDPAPNYSSCQIPTDLHMVQPTPQHHFPDF